MATRTLFGVGDYGHHNSLTIRHVTALGSGGYQSSLPPTFDHSDTATDELTTTDLIRGEAYVFVFEPLQGFPPPPIPTGLSRLSCLSFEPAIYPSPRFCIFIDTSFALWASAESVRLVDTGQRVEEIL